MVRLPNGELVQTCSAGDREGLAEIVQREGAGRYGLFAESG
jgi:hypothetical protein